jgi:hypothetical protein
MLEVQQALVRRDFIVTRPPWDVVVLALLAAACVALAAWRTIDGDF